MVILNHRKCLLTNLLQNQNKDINLNQQCIFYLNLYLLVKFNQKYDNLRAQGAREITPINYVAVEGWIHRISMANQLKWQYAVFAILKCVMKASYLLITSFATEQAIALNDKIMEMN